MSALGDTNRRFEQAAIAIATAVDVRDRLDSDPGYVGDRSALANEIRRERMAAYLAEFRAARAAFEEVAL